MKRGRSWRRSSGCRPWHRYQIHDIRQQIFFTNSLSTAHDRQICLLRRYCSLQDRARNDKVSLIYAFNLLYQLIRRYQYGYGRGSNHLNTLPRHSRLPSVLLLQMVLRLPLFFIQFLLRTPQWPPLHSGASGADIADVSAAKPERYHVGSTSE